MSELRLYGTVGSSFWDEDFFTARQVREQLDGMSGPLTVRINSGGGIATEGQAIYTALRAYEGEVNVVIEGVATCEVDGAVTLVRQGESIDVPTGARHRLGNEGDVDLVIVEVQLGGYTGEDDIERFADDFGRCGG